MSVKIAIIGASNQQNPLILRAKARNYETHTFAWNDGEDAGIQSSDHFYPISAANKEEILQKCREIGIDAVASIGSDMSAQAASYVAADMGLHGNKVEGITLATNKILTRRRFDEIGIPQPRYVEIGDAIALDRIRELNYPLIIKPSDRSGARGIKVIYDESEFFGAVNQARDISFERKAVAEEYIDGNVYSCECVSYNRDHKVVGYTKRSVDIVNGKPCEYKYTQPAAIPRSIIKRVEKELPRALDALEIASGVSSAEFIVDEKGDIFFIEISPYMYGDYIGTDLAPVAYGVELTDLVLDISMGIAPEIFQKETGVVATVEFEYSKIDGARGDVTFSKSPIKEFGGCPSFKITDGKSYYSNNEYTLALNSEYTAFWYALVSLESERVYIPYYCSPSWERIALNADVECVRYHIGEDLMPIDVDPKENDAVLLINHHGLCAEKIKDLNFKKKIVDNSMSFYQEPILEEGVYNIYSCRKFFAVADGAYLISSSLAKGARIDLERDTSYRRASALLKSLELGQSAAYKDMQTNEQELARKRCKMSLLTERMLASVDYELEKRSRKENFEILNKHLKQFNLIRMDETPNAVPQYYPLLIKEDIRGYLLAKKIFVPLMWRSTLSKEFDGMVEKTLSEGLMCLPISPEYSTKDMEYLAETVISLIS